MKKLIFAVLLITGCATFEETSREVLKGTAGVIKIVADGLPEFNKSRQAEIVAQAKSKAEGKAKLAEWRAVMGKLEFSVSRAWGAVTVAAKGLVLYSAGAAKQSDLSKWISDVVSTLAALKNELQAYGVKIPGVPS